MSKSRSKGRSLTGKLARIGQFQIWSGGLTGQGVMRRMNTARAWAHSAEAGQPPARHNKMAQSTG
jgi:hypothetical protein